MPRLPLRLLTTLFDWLLAQLILFEEWGWEPLQRALAWVARLPVKLLALWLIGQGQLIFGTTALAALPAPYFPVKTVNTPV